MIPGVVRAIGGGLIRDILAGRTKLSRRVIALIEDPQVIRRILEHRGQWALQPSERSPPLYASAWPLHAKLALSQHPVPDIA